MSRTPNRTATEVVELRCEVARLNARVDDLTALVQRSQLELFRRIAELQGGTPTEGTRSGTVESWKVEDYAQLVRRVHGAISSAVPAGSLVAVVSRGDDALIDIAGRTGRHFPCVEDGRYAGHHPRDDEAAIAAVEQLRAAGGAYLVFPATARWWLQHYRGLRRHLETTARLVLQHPDTCVIFSLP